MNPYKKVQIIVTLGPSSMEPETLKKIEHTNVDYVRINLSHTRVEEIESTIEKITKTIKTPLLLDTEGSQVRTGYLGGDSITFAAGEEISLHSQPCKCDVHNLYLRPAELFPHLKVGDLIFVDFDTVVLRVDDVSSLKDNGCVKCSVITGGVIGNNKAVTIDNQEFSLPALSEKDIAAINIAKKKRLSEFTVSFVDCKEDVQEVRKIIPEAKVISKIETRKGVDNLDEILSVSDGILIDRGDLSREVPLERIPLAQKMITSHANLRGKPVFVATNLLDTMMHSLKPSRAEVNDIVNTLLDGADGLVLAAETAIGNHPVETINFIKKVANQVEPFRKLRVEGSTDTLQVIESLGNNRYITSPTTGDGLITPHGGELVNRVLQVPPSNEELRALPVLEISKESAMDAEQIAIGTFSPLKGFMTEGDFNSVMNQMRLESGVVWTLPVVLQVTESEKESISGAEQVLLIEKNTKEKVAILQVESLFRLNKEEATLKYFGTNDLEHPGVRQMVEAGDYVVGGKIDLINRLDAPFKHHQLTPLQTRKIFESKGWSRVVGFHTRNAVHRSHEFIQRYAMKEGHCDGIFIHPVVGKKKKGDFLPEVIIKSYAVMIQKFYPSETALFGTFATYSRYMGPREAVFTALCRQNFGCSHFVVGRDHTGVGDFYPPDGSHKIFDEFPDLVVEPIRIEEVGYSEKQASHIIRTDAESIGEDLKSISGTELRKILEIGEVPPEWFMRPEISREILNLKGQGQKLFVE